MINDWRKLKLKFRLVGLQLSRLLKQSDIPMERMNLWKPGKPERARGHARKKRVFKKDKDRKNG